MCDLDAVPPEDRNCMLLSYTNDEWRSLGRQPQGTPG